MSRLGLNIHAAYTHGRDQIIIDHVRAAKPRAVLVMDGIALALAIRRASPETEIVYRHYVPDDVYMHQTPGQWFAQHRSFAETYGFTLYVLNEPNFTSAVINWLAEVALLCLRNGIRAVIGNWSVGRPEPTQWVLADSLLKLIIASRHLLTLGLHEYAPLLMQYEARADPRILPNTAPPRTWLLGRWRYLLDRYPDVPVMITEFGWDAISAVRQWQEPRAGGWKKHIGYLSSRPFWQANQPEHPDVYAARQVEWALKHYYSYSQIRAVLLWCAGGSEPDWSDSDVTRVPDFLRALRTMKEGETVTYSIREQGKTLVRAETGGANVNLRLLPHTGASVIGLLKTGTVIDYYVDSRADGSGFQWRRLASGAWFALVPDLTLGAVKEPPNDSVDAIRVVLNEIRQRIDAVDAKLNTLR
jgi:hypothetical protein